MSSYNDSTSNTTPMKLPRLVALFFSFAFAVISGSVGLNALVKSNQQQSKLRKLLPAGTTLVVDTDDVFHTGVIVTTISALIALLTLIYILLLLLPIRSKISLSTRTLPFQWATLAFCSIWILAVQIPFTAFFATRSAGVTAFVGSTQVPDALVKVIENQLGVSSVYRHIGYLRLVAILPWFTILFTAIAAGVSFVASRRRLGSRQVPTTAAPTTDDTSPVLDQEFKEKEKERPVGSV